MNIFVTDPCPIRSAVNLDNVRVVKMVLESAQLLSNAVHSLDLEGPYRKTHWNHPCSIWSRLSRENYTWLLNHFSALCNEYTYRFEKTHKCQQLSEIFVKSACLFPDEDIYRMERGIIYNPKEFTFVNCTTNHKHIKDVFKAYQAEMNLKWRNDKRTPKWSKRVPPLFAIGINL
jgi:hypothetical protein